MLFHWLHNYWIIMQNMKLIRIRDKVVHRLKTDWVLRYVFKLIVDNIRCVRIIYNHVSLILFNFCATCITKVLGQFTHVTLLSREDWNIIELITKYRHLKGSSVQYGMVGNWYFWNFSDFHIKLCNWIQTTF